MMAINSYVLANLAYAYIIKEQFDKAVIICEEAIKQEKSNVYAWCNLGTALAHLSKYEQAYAKLKHALSIDNTIIPALTTLCGVCVKLSKFDGGEIIGQQTLQKCLMTVTFYIMFQNHLLHDILAACKYIQKAIELKP